MYCICIVFTNCFSYCIVFVLYFLVFKNTSITGLVIKRRQRGDESRIQWLPFVLGPLYPELRSINRHTLSQICIELRRRHDQYFTDSSAATTLYSRDCARRDFHCGAMALEA